MQIKKSRLTRCVLHSTLPDIKATSRADLFSRLDEATTSTEAMVELQTNLIVQNQILDLVLSNSKELDQASIDKIIQNFETDIDPYLDTIGRPNGICRICLYLSWVVRRLSWKRIYHFLKPRPGKTTIRF